MLQKMRHTYCREHNHDLKVRGPAFTSLAGSMLTESVISNQKFVLMLVSNMKVLFAQKHNRHTL